MVSAALGSCQYRVVIMNHHRRGSFIAEKICIDSAGSADKAIRRCALAQSLHIMALMLTSNHQRPVLFK